MVACTWLLSLSGVSTDQAEQAVGTALDQSSLLVERERKGQRSVDDVRAAIESLQVTSVAEDPRPHLCAVLVTNGRGLRPTELVGALFPTLDPIDLTGRVLRTHQWIERDGVRRDIVPTPAVATRTPVECA